MKTLIIESELQQLLPPLEPEEIERLTISLREQGCYDALTIWEGRDIILDGHNRYSLCQQYGIEFMTRSIPIVDLNEAKEWMTPFTRRPK